MASILDNVRATKVERHPTEEWVAAIRVELSNQPWVPALGSLLLMASNALSESPLGIKLPDTMIWAVTNHRLFLWSADLVTNKKPRERLATYALGWEVRDASAGNGSFGTVRFALSIRGCPFTVKAEAAPAQRMAAQIQHAQYQVDVAQAQIPITPHPAV